MGRKINNCGKCGGEGWLWWFELKHYSGPAEETGSDDQKYTCDKCHGEPIQSVLMLSFDPQI